ncbi:LysR family transcriptional regulator [Niveibacterium umoris]|uniref:DNA-binding transcriptional LysR family regulator n=2 Tax=Niveibacterium umoris TaxID=1193620 RepID=A0A840BPD7_9RHOO|nr:LysR family transcriptional regulator [Niveibacterium umoris]MBB4013388.1 DNA-binding transcriptional LysR family regulator [Niveibacterium umoris]
MHATLRQLRLFLALAETGSVTAAAREQHVTQPTVSMQLKQLADSVGLPLYEVTGRKLHLTEAGERLAQTCRDLFDRWDAFEMEVDGLRGLTRGRLRVAVVSTAKYFIPRLLGPFSERYPAIEVSLEVANRDRIVSRLEQNLDDLVIMTAPPEHLDLRTEPLLENPLVLVGALAHPLAKRTRPAPRGVLSQERFILREPGSGTRISCERAFAEWGFVPQVRMALGSNEAIKQAVAGGYGIAVLSRHALDRDPQHDGLALLQVQGFPIRSRWYLVTRREKRLSPVAEAFLAFVKASVETVKA